MRVIYTSKGMSKKFWGARYTLGAPYLSKNTVIICHLCPSNMFQPLQRHHQEDMYKGIKYNKFCQICVYVCVCVCS